MNNNSLSVCRLMLCCLQHYFEIFPNYAFYLKLLVQDLCTLHIHQRDIKKVTRWRRKDCVCMCMCMFVRVSESDGECGGVCRYLDICHIAPFHIFVLYILLSSICVNFMCIIYGVYWYNQISVVQMQASASTLYKYNFY
mmetsp:Transcript_9289/g.19116  ORF Transcript_9289/g.19116 Transcript_9289/m.19116 type:complete len:139 (+) Transcript_9289:78-494(+)